MHKKWIWAILLLAAMLEAGGDTLVRLGLRSSGGSRWMAMAAGGLVLFGYAVMVNASDWDFGKVIGVYIMFFFLVAQLLSWVAFREVPSMGRWIGGALIAAGAIVVGIAE
ncbi:MAG TPA: hypothetical protein VG297_11260 [Bryobacteraceae bacterium]|jgi:small multidrug resistance family-3 protein|nr:hypothetical protein [Bryobacteraceae bacterium]